jgi:ATP phosphoribosyltransferase regulatory subunit
LLALKDLNLPAPARTLCDHLAELVAFLDGRNGGLTLTIDPGESRGFEYQTGVSFSLFADGVRGELGRGGRYSLAGGESAIGFTLYLDSLMRAIPEPTPPGRLYVPFNTPAEISRQMRAGGWITVQGLDGDAEALAEAKALACDHILHGGQAAKL